MSPLGDSSDPWRYAIFLSKSIFLFIDVGLIKSFGVLVPEMVVRFDSDYKTIAFICGLPSFMFAASPIAHLFMKVVRPQTLGMIGGLLIAVPIICASLTDSLFLLATFLVSTGFGLALTYLPLVSSVNDFFSETFIFTNAITQFGTTFGAFVMPVVIERSLEAYGYQGAFIILGGIALHAVVCAACVRIPKDLRQKSDDMPQNGDSVRQNGDGLRQNCDDLRQNGDCFRAKDSTLDEGSTEQTQKATLRAMVEQKCLDRKECYQAIKSTDYLLHANKTQLSLKERILVCFAAMHCPTSTTSRDIVQWFESFTIAKEPFFALVIPSIFLGGYVEHSWMLFLVSHAECSGIKQSQAVFLSTIAAVGGAFGRAFYLILLKCNVRTSTIFFFSCLICAASFFLDSLSSTFTSFAITALVQGFIIFLFAAFNPALMKMSLRNEANMPSGISIMVSAQATGMIIGDVTSGHIFDVASSCSTLFISLGIILVATSVNLAVYIYTDRYYRGKGCESVSDS